MPEGINVEVAQRLNEKGAAEHESRSLEILEILEALILAIVTVVTAWSGYQAARWDGRSALYYGHSSRERTQANKLATLGGQKRLYDISTFNSWLQAQADGKSQLTALLKRRFTPGYKVAFDAWLKT